jgi:menaquinone-dependent protoporphyrinogen oxidase
METIAVFYATREGQTRRIAEQAAARLRDEGFAVELFNVAELDATRELADCAGAILAASVHIGKHEPEMIAFVRRHRAELERIPNAFLSVSMSAAGVEDSHRTDEQRARARSDVRYVIDRFVKDTGWQPQQTQPIAGALRYSQYNPLIRLIMRLISWRAGGPTDPRHDSEFTDWAALDRFVDGFGRGVADGAAGRPADRPLPIDPRPASA